MSVPCPTCNGPMRALFTGAFCPTGCDRTRAMPSNDQGWITRSDWVWEYTIVPNGGGLPAGAEYGWYVMTGEEMLAFERCECVQRCQSLDCSPGWPADLFFAGFSDCFFFRKKKGS